MVHELYPKYYLPNKDNYGNGHTLFGTKFYHNASFQKSKF